MYRPCAVLINRVQSHSRHCLCYWLWHLPLNLQRSGSSAGRSLPWHQHPARRGLRPFATVDPHLPTTRPPTHPHTHPPHPPSHPPSLHPSTGIHPSSPPSLLLQISKAASLITANRSNAVGVWKIPYQDREALEEGVDRYLLTRVATPKHVRTCARTYTHTNTLAEKQTCCSRAHLTRGTRSSICK